MNLKTIILAPLTLALLAAGIHLGAVTRSIRDRVMTDDDRYYLPPAEWLRVFSLGYNELAADLVWVKTLVYFGDMSLKTWAKDKKAAAANHTANYTTNYMWTVCDLDPRFRSVYNRGSALALFQRGNVSEQTAQMAIEILERGHREFPDDGEIAFSLGFIHYYEMEPFLPKDKDDPKRRFHKNAGLQMLRKSTFLENAPRYASLLASSLMSQAGMNDVVVEHLKTMLQKETDPEIRKELIFKLRKELGALAELDIRTSEQLQARWREDMPFVPYDLYLLMDSQFSIDQLLNPLSWSNRVLGLDETSDASAVDDLKKISAGEPGS